MKKIFYFSILAFLAMGMTACNDDNSGNEGGGGETPELVTGDYLVSIYTDLEGTATEDIVLRISGEKGAYTIENLFGIGGLPLMATYTDYTLVSDGSFQVGGQVAQVFDKYWGLEDSQTGEVSQAFGILSSMDPNFNVGDDPMLINANKQTSELAEFGSNLILLLAPASLEGNDLIVDQDNAVVAGVITTGMPLSLMDATASLKSVRPVSKKIAPVAPVKITKVIR